MIRYRCGYKYQLAADYYLVFPHTPAVPIDIPYLSFDVTGLLTIRQGYCWDGPSGPTVDTKTSLRSSLVHDAIYQLIRLELLPEDPWRLWADEALRTLCIEDGMNHVRATVWYRMVRRFAGPASHPSAERPVLLAP